MMWSLFYWRKRNVYGRPDFLMILDWFDEWCLIR